MADFLVTPVKTGVPLPSGHRSGIDLTVTSFPAFAGMMLSIFLVFLLLIAAPAYSQTFPPRPQTPVLDQAGLLRPEQRLDIESKARALQSTTGRTLFVATVNSLEGVTIEEYATQLGRQWKVGREKEDDGVILLVAPNEKKVRIETGYGAEGFLPDILAGRIIRDTILPKFREGDMAGGIVAGSDAIVRQMSITDAEAGAAIADAQRQEARRGEEVGFLPVIIIVIIFFAIIGSIARRVGGRRYHSKRHRRGGIDPWIVLWGLNELSRASRGGRGWGGGGSWGGGGGFGGGGGSFGGFGGSFGGGGASGSW